MSITATAKAIKQMRVLMVLEATEGGTARHISELASALTNLGVEVQLIYSMRRNVAFSRTVRSLQDAGVILTELDMRRSISPGRDFAAILKMRRLILAIAPDILHLHSSKAGYIGRVAAALAKFPSDRVIYTPHAYAFLDGRVTCTFLYRVAEQVLTRWTGCVAAVSESERQLALSLSSSTPVALYRNGTKGEAPQTIARPSEPLRIGWIGRMVRQKEPVLALRVAAVLARLGCNFRLVMFGDGPQLLLCRRLATEFGLDAQVQFAGFVEDIGRVYDDMDVLLSTSRYEGMPYSMLDAMARSIPVVGFDVPGVSDLVRHSETGLLARWTEVGCVAGHLERLGSDVELRARLGNGARLLVEEHHRLVDSIQGILEIYKVMAVNSLAAGLRSPVKRWGRGSNEKRRAASS